MTQAELESSFLEIARSAAALFGEGRIPLGVNVWFSDGFEWHSGLGCDSLNPEEWEPVLAETLRSSLTRTRHSRSRPVFVKIWFSDRMSIHYALPAEEGAVAEGRESLSHCKQDIMSVVLEINHRLLTREILHELHVRNLVWGESTVKRSLAEMVRQGQLNNRRDVRPRGYGLREWD